MCFEHSYLSSLEKPLHNGEITLRFDLIDLNPDILLRLRDDLLVPLVVFFELREVGDSLIHFGLQHFDSLLSFWISSWFGGVLFGGSWLTFAGSISRSWTSCRYLDLLQCLQLSLELFE